MAETVRRQRPRPPLRGARRDPRRRAEPPAAGRGAAAHGAAGRPRSRGDSRRQGPGVQARCARSIRPRWCAGSSTGYRHEAGVAPDSDVETYVALRLHVDSWRWAGVPVYIRTGKCLASRPPRCSWRSSGRRTSVFDDVPTAPPNHVRFRLSPDVVIELGARAKRPGDAMVGEAVDLDACRNTADDARRPISGCSATRCAATRCSSPAPTRWRPPGASSSPC